MQQQGDASARTLALPGVDTSERRGPAIALSISSPYGTHPLIARAEIEAALADGPLARALQKLGLVAKFL